MIAQSFYTAATAFLTLSPALVYLAAGYLIFVGDTGVATAGTVIAFTALQARLYQPVERLLQVSVELQTSVALFERIFGYLDLEQEITDAPDALPLERDKVDGEVAFDTVSVSSRSYHGSDSNLNQQGELRQWTLDGVSFRIEPGQLAAFVGPSGAGKTSIAALVPRLYDVTEGSVSIDGIDVRQIRLADLAATVGFVTQESFLLQTTIEDNLRYGKARRHPGTKSWRRQRRPTSTTALWNCLPDTPPWWASGVSGCPSASGSDCPSRGRCCTSRAS